MFADLDWSTPARHASLREHWRFTLGMFAGFAIATRLIHLEYPHTFWFMKFWAGGAIGLTAGTAVILPWQLFRKGRRKRTSGRLIVSLLTGWGLFAMVSFLVVLPDLASQEDKLRCVRAWSTRDIVSIAIEQDDHSIVWIDDPSVIASFVTYTQRATLFYPSHEGSVANGHLTFHLSDDRFESFPTRIPERHQFDVSLTFRGYSSYCEILLPNARDWLSSLERPRRPDRGA